MSDVEESNAEIKPFAVERAKQGRAKCQKCKNSCESKELRIAKNNPNNPFGSTPLKQWYHLDCFRELKNKDKSKIDLTNSSQVEGFEKLSAEDQKIVVNKLGPNFKVDSSNTKSSSSAKSQPIKKSINSKDNSFREFCQLVVQVANEPSYNSKSAIIRTYIEKGTSGKKFEGSLDIWLKLLMPGIDKRVYNLQDKQLVKLFSRIFAISHNTLVQDLQGSGDVSETVAKFFPQSKNIKPAATSTLTVTEIDNFLEELSTKTQEEAQTIVFEKICCKCTAIDLKIIIRLIKHDLKMNARERHVLDAIHEKAYESFQKTRDLTLILQQFVEKSSSASSSGQVQVMIAFSPMLAEACKDFDRALKKCPEGFYSEIKYDGERVQIHKRGNDFKFFSRNLKPVQEHKVAKLKEYLPKAFPSANNLILDSEIIMVDTKTGNLLPFGTLGRHKKEEFEHASACLFVFDCLLFNDSDLTKKTLRERKQFLDANIKPVKYHVELSEYKLLRKKNELIEMTKDVLKKGLEGLVLKGLNSVYEPGKRRWLKVKKDYLMQGQIADSADLVVLGAYFGTGKMRNQYSIFLMGCFDEKTSVWKTVTKVHSGLDDNSFAEINEKLSSLMEPCNSYSIPSFVRIDRSLIPDFIAKNPYGMPVFEIHAAEFTDSDVHTANSISMRFPRISRIRMDKSPKEATTLSELVHLYEESKAGIHIDELNKLKTDSQSNDDESKSKKNSIKTLFSKAGDATKRKPNDKEPDDEAPLKKLKIRQLEDNKNDDAKIFSSLILYVYESNGLESAETECFKKLGGKITKNSHDANLVLYESNEVKGTLEDMRKMFSLDCRHRQKTWLLKCMETNTFVNPIHYYVKISRE